MWGCRNKMTGARFHTMCVSPKAYVCHLLRLAGVVFFGSWRHLHKK